MHRILLILLIILPSLTSIGAEHTESQRSSSEIENIITDAYTRLYLLEQCQNNLQNPELSQEICLSEHRTAKEKAKAALEALDNVEITAYGADFREKIAYITQHKALIDSIKRRSSSYTSRIVVPRLPISPSPPRTQSPHRQEGSSTPSYSPHSPISSPPSSTALPLLPLNRTSSEKRYELSKTNSSHDISNGESPIKRSISERQPTPPHRTISLQNVIRPHDSKSPRTPRRLPIFKAQSSSSSSHSIDEHAPPDSFDHGVKNFLQKITSPRQSHSRSEQSGSDSHVMSLVEHVEKIKEAEFDTKLDVLFRNAHAQIIPFFDTLRAKRFFFKERPRKSLSFKNLVVKVYKERKENEPFADVFLRKLSKLTIDPDTRDAFHGLKQIILEKHTEKDGIKEEYYAERLLINLLVLRGLNPILTLEKYKIKDIEFAKALQTEVEMLPYKQEIPREWHQIIQNILGQ